MTDVAPDAFDEDAVERSGVKPGGADTKPAILPEPDGETPRKHGDDASGLEGLRNLS